MKLSKRLLAVADMVTPGSVLADIGTDHAYIPIYLIEQEIIPCAYAMDVNRGPLARAEEHIREHGLTEQIEIRLSDGLAALQPGEAQSVVIAGMGGALTIRILQDGENLLRESEDGISAEKDSISAEKDGTGTQVGSRHFGIQEIILQPQSEVPQVRAYLEKAGFSIVREDMVLEDGKYYPMMKAVRSADAAADTCTAHIQASREAQVMFGPELLRMRHPVLHQYLLRERATQERIMESLEQNAGAPVKAPSCSVPADAEDAASLDRVKQRTAEVQHDLRLIEEALALFSVETSSCCAPARAERICHGENDARLADAKGRVKNEII